MSFPGIEYLSHIMDEINYLKSHTERLNRDKFMNDETLQRAFVRSIEIIGEAAKKLPEELKQKYSNIEWKAIAGMRDRLIHDYFGIDYDIVWDVVINKIPQSTIINRQYSILQNTCHLKQIRRKFPQRMIPHKATNPLCHKIDG